MTQDLTDKIEEAIANLKAAVWQLTDSVNAVTKEVDELRKRETTARRKLMHVVKGNDG